LIEKGQYLTEVYFWSVAPNFILEWSRIIYVCLFQPGVIFCLKSAKLLFFGKLQRCFGFPCDETSGYQLLFATSTWQSSGWLEVFQMELEANSSYALSE
jgi:hypothetical protein